MQIGYPYHLRLDIATDTGRYLFVDGGGWGRSDWRGRYFKGRHIQWALYNVESQV